MVDAAGEAIGFEPYPRNLEICVSNLFHDLSQGGGRAKLQELNRPTTPNENKMITTHFWVAKKYSRTIFLHAFDFRRFVISCGDSFEKQGFALADFFADGHGFSIGRQDFQCNPQSQAGDWKS